MHHDLYGPMRLFLMRADTLRGQVGGGWALEIESFWATWNGIEPIAECHLGPKKLKISRAQTFPLAQVMDLPVSKIIMHREV